MRRRDFITLVGGALVPWPVAARAQGPSGRPLVAILNATTASAVSPRVHEFMQGMREFGHVEGRDFDLADRYAEGHLERLSALADEVVRLKANLLVAGSMPALFAAQQASKTIPIIGVSLVDPVGLGLAASEARPGGQVTGTLSSIEGLPGKQLALAIEVIPNVSRVGLLINPRNQGHAMLQQGAQTAAAALSRSVVPAEASSSGDLNSAFEVLARERVDLVMVLPDPIFNSANGRIAVLAAAKRLPTMNAFREYVEAGGTMSYGVSLGANWHRAAYFADRILKGNKLGDLPIELPTKLELVINLSTARAIGISIAEHILQRADEVIE